MGPTGFRTQDELQTVPPQVVRGVLGCQVEACPPCTGEFRFRFNLCEGTKTEGLTEPSSGTPGLSHPGGPLLSKVPVQPDLQTQSSKVVDACKGP